MTNQFRASKTVFIMIIALALATTACKMTTYDWNAFVALIAALFIAMGIMGLSKD